MATRIVEVQGFSGPHFMRLPEDGEKIRLNRDAFHGDWKTVSVRHGQWPTIPKGTEVEVVGWMQNMEGVHLRVKHLEWIYDIPTYKFDWRT